jgi:hypothetical protein
MVKVKDEHTNFEKSETFWTYPELPAGDHQLDFSFKLPDGLSSSCFFKDKKLHSEPSCKIRYKIKCTLKIHDMDDWKYK